MILSSVEDALWPQEAFSTPASPGGLEAWDLMPHLLAHTIDRSSKY